MEDENTLKAGPLKIAMLSVHSCPVGELGTRDTGGMSVYIRELARELGAKGHKIDVYTRFHSTKDDQIIELGENARLIHIKAGINSDMRKLDIYPHLPEFTAALEDFRKRDGMTYDLVHSHYWLSGRVGRWAQWRWNVPHIVMFHTLGKIKNAIGVGEVEPEIRLITEKMLVDNCCRIIAPTENGKRELIRHYGAFEDTVRVVPCGVNLTLFKPVEKGVARKELGLDLDKSVLLYVGRIDPLKGIERLLMAGPYLKKYNQGIRFLIIGGNGRFQPDLQKLQCLSRDLGIQDSVIFKGRVKQEYLPLYYSAADVLVVPSYHESFGLVALESLSCGTPVIATDVGGIGGMIREGRNGYLVVGDISRSIAEKTEIFLSNSSNGMGSPESIRASVGSFCWSNVANALIDEYRSLLSNRFSQAVCGIP